MKKPFYLFFILGILFAGLYAKLLTLYFGFDNPLNYVLNVQIGGYYFWLLIIPMILIWGIFIVISDEKIKSDYGNARWAKTRDIKKMNLNMFSKEGIILGIWKNKYIRTDQTLSVLVAAPPGTGKTVAVAIPNLLSCPWSIIVNDVKNELWEQTSLHRKKYQKVIRFAPAEPGSAKWNPFSELPDNFVEQKTFLSRLASVIYVTKGDAKSDHWHVKAQSIFIFFAIVVIFEEEREQKPSCVEVRAKILNTHNVQDYAAKYQDNFEETDNESLNTYIQTATNSIIQIANEEFSSIMSTVVRELDVFDDPHIAANTSSSDFKIEELRQDKLTIYLSSSMKDAARIQPITRLFIELATLHLLADKPKNDQKVLILADEFVKMGKMKQLMSAPDLSRGQKLAVIFIMQSLGQPKEVYGKDATETLISTTAFKIIFTQLSTTTMKEVSDLIGKKTIKKMSVSKQSSWKSAGNNKSVSEEGQHLILPQDVGSLRDDQVIIIAQGYNTRPILAKSCRWFKIPAMKKLVVKNTENN